MFHLHTCVIEGNFFKKVKIELITILLSKYYESFFLFTKGQLLNCSFYIPKRFTILNVTILIT